MVYFLIKEVGIDAETSCFEVSRIYCCFPSIHDVKETNFSAALLMTAKAFIENGEILSGQNSFKHSGHQASGLGIIHTASHISNDELRQSTIELIVQTNIQRVLRHDCAIIENSGRNAADHLLAGKNPQQLTP